MDERVATTPAFPVSSSVRAQVADLRRSFSSASPFPHVVIDDFFDRVYAEALLAQFPAFERGNFVNEHGQAGNKSVVERIHALGDAYASLDAGVQSRDFLDLVGGITGINELLYDPDYFGGGTHENRDGQSLDAHIDFNYHPRTRWHRRLNLIVYLNPHWEAGWGGCLELHRDPYAGEADEVVSILPAFNRCVIFETTEHSWHGFPPIAVPERHAGVSRRSIALYFYTRERPAEQTSSAHSTVYVDRPLPDRFRVGHALSEVDVAELQAMLQRRDEHNRRLYGDLRALQAQLDETFAGRVFNAIRRRIAR